ncbi:uncharacterized protein PFL1_03685 [Pseudozyma flocculosa PF-1]|uniref:Uncharacterized protein n=1 Tax=Pseudozyma flocculosa PF-1 TaxID=1277687 RepID=A0A061H8T5_9BASI|nr:uncharacterized protein PFL1_03685 [Pseudozyma flocculosa PF-1]EPQ28884.1 hypothetical protein PFL1_03685 [Pseudozyma flocculosa PF-1]
MTEARGGWAYPLQGVQLNLVLLVDMVGRMSSSSTRERSSRQREEEQAGQSAGWREQRQTGSAISCRGGVPVPSASRHVVEEQGFVWASTRVVLVCRLPCPSVRQDLASSCLSIFWHRDNHGFPSVNGRDSSADLPHLWRTGKERRAEMKLAQPLLPHLPPRRRAPIQDKTRRDETRRDETRVSGLTLTC